MIKIYKIIIDYLTDLNGFRLRASHKSTTNCRLFLISIPIFAIILITKNVSRKPTALVVGVCQINHHFDKMYLFI